MIPAARRRIPWALFGIVLVVWGCGGPPQVEQGPSSEAGAEAVPDPNADRLSEEEPLGEPEGPRRVTLYFSDSVGRLTPETRRIEPFDRTADEARAVVQALLEGPRGALVPVLPADAKIRAVHLAPDGTVYVDLDQAFSTGLERGSKDALIAVRSITETLAANFDEIHRVKILVEGEEVRELGGHLDLSRPLVPASSHLPEASAPTPGDGLE